MEQLQETLIYIINHRLFASSPTAFGKLFSENDRNRGIRIVKGVTKNFDSTIQKFEEKFDLTANGLYELMEADKLANALSRSFPEDCVDSEQEEYGNRMLLALMQENYKELPDGFAEYIDVISEMRYQKREQYLWFLALFFIKYGMYRIYHSHFKKDYYSMWENLGRCFKEKFPNRTDLHSFVNAYTATDLYCETCHPSVWGLMQHLVPILDIAEDPGRREERLRIFHLFDWGLDSYWRKPNLPFELGKSEIWWLYVVETKIPNNGFYTVIHFKSGNNKDNFELIEVYNLMFIEIEDEEYSYIVHLCKTNDLQSVVLGFANYHEDTQTLSFEFDDEVDFPSSLQMIEMETPVGSGNKVWKHIINHFKEHSRDFMLKQAKNRLGNLIFLDDEYEVDDVVVGRKGMFIAIKELLLPNQPIREYSIEWDKHEVLKCIHPSDDACIVRKNDDGELYIAWLEKDLQIKLKEFKEEKLLY